MLSGSGRLSAKTSAAERRLLWYWSIEDALGSDDVVPSPPPPPLLLPPDGAIVASCTSKLYISEDYGNYNCVMHGGAAGVIFDMMTTIALGPVARPGFWE